VQFFTFGPSLQATLAGLILIFLGWVAFATVNVIFKDRIIAAKDHRFQQMQSAYENRLADLQISYDELNGALVGAEDKFKATADELQTKQNAITGFLARKKQIEVAVGTRDAAPARPAQANEAASDSVGFAAAPPRSGAPDVSEISDEDSVGGASLTVMPGPVAPQPRTGRAPAKAAAIIDSFWHRLARLAGNLFSSSASADIQLSAAYSQHPALRALAEQTARVARMGKDETRLMARTEVALKADVDSFRMLVRRTGINPDALEHKVAAEGIGGPEISLDQVHIDGISDPGFSTAYLHAQAVLSQLGDLSQEVSHIPLSLPVDSGQFDRSSGFGSRIDPFTGHYAFHPGIDFAGPWGSKVTATAAGTVVFAGYRGGYGNMVEIDHGLGIRTRYGHLSAIGVKPGAHIAKGGVLGRVGSTGRSTGPHVHYEVWFDDVVRNPTNFIEAGHHVL
jgi:murein DD-endopeptidase MepM/ murein hydrolase activator NlpD